MQVKLDLYMYKNRKWFLQQDPPQCFSVALSSFGSPLCSVCNQMKCNFSFNLLLCLLQLVNVCVFCQLESVFMLGRALWSSSEVPEAWLRGGEANLGEGWEGVVGSSIVKRQRK